MDTNNNSIFEQLEIINNIYNNIYSLSPEIISSDDKNKFNQTILKNKFNFSKIQNNDLPLKVCVVGTIKVGKSEFINSIIKEKLLKVYEIPATKKVTVLKYGDDFKIYKIDNDKNRIEITLEEHKILSNHSQTDKSGIKKSEIDNIHHFEILYPSEILKNINIADTPGFSSINKEDDTLTKKWIKKADCLIWIFDANIGDIEIQELDILNGITLNTKVIAIVNKIDLKETVLEKEKVFQSFKNSYNFHSVLPYSAKKIRNYETSIKDSENIVLEILNDAKKSILKGDKLFTYIENHKITYIENNKIIIQDDRINQELLKTFIDNKLSNEYIEYKNSLKKLLMDLKKEPVNIKSEVLQDKAFDIYKQELRNLINIKSTIKENYSYEKLISNYTNFRNEIKTKIEKNINRISDAEKVDLIEDIVQNIINNLKSNKTIDKLDILENRVFGNIYNALINYIVSSIIYNGSKVKVVIAYKEYYNYKSVNYFATILNKINIFVNNYIKNHPKMTREKFFKHDFFGGLLDYVLEDLIEKYFDFNNDFIDYYFDKYIFSNINEEIEISNDIYSSIVELNNNSKKLLNK